MTIPTFKIVATDRVTGQTVYGRRGFRQNALSFRTSLGIHNTPGRDLGLHTRPEQGEPLQIDDAARYLVKLNEELQLTGSSWIVDPRIIQAL